MQGSPSAFFHGDVGVFRVGAHELRFRTIDVDHRVEADRLRHHAAPASFERTRDVRFRLGRWPRGNQKGILELNPGTVYGLIATQTDSDFFFSYVGPVHWSANVEIQL